MKTRNHQARQVPAADPRRYRLRHQGSGRDQLFELIAARYERRSLLITANQPFGEWGKIFSDQDVGGYRPARAPCHDPGDERRELSPESCAQAQAWLR